MTTLPTIIITFIGDDFQPGVREAAKEAAIFINDYGALCAVETVQNLCYVPHFGLGAMKNFALMRALERGATHFMLLETDVLLDKDILYHMIRANKDIVVPYYDQSGLENPPYVVMRPQVEIKGDQMHPITWEYESDNGPQLDKPPGARFEDGHLLQLEWAVMSCMMFRMELFSADKLTERPFTEVPIVKNEEYNCLWWRRRGAEIWMDGNAHAKLLKPPTSTGGVAKQLFVKPPLGTPNNPPKVAP